MDFDKALEDALRKAGSIASSAGAKLEDLLRRAGSFSERYAHPARYDGGDVQALKGFIHNVCAARNMSANESTENIRKSIVSLHWGNGASNGLLITSNGYILTAKHCVTKRNGGKYALWQGKDYSLKEKVCSIPAESDLALIKADMPGPASPRIYKIFPGGLPRMNTPVIMLSIMNYLYERSEGLVTVPSYKATFEDGSTSHDSVGMLMAGTRKGKSGSPIINSVTGELVGICSGGIGITCAGAKSKRALEIVSVYAEYLRNRK